MRRATVIGPLVLYTAGCALRPFTPAVSVAIYGQEAYSPVTMDVPRKVDAIARWQLPPANPWAGYQKLTLLASLDEVQRAAVLPDVGHLDVVDDARRAAIKLSVTGLPNDTMWVVDLRGAASVIFGAALSRRTVAPPSLVLTFNNWPAENELIPAEETLAALVLAEPQPPDPTATTHVPVFLLDAWRLAYRYEAPEDDVTDNRYFLSPTDLPSPEVLQKQGIRRVVYVVEDLDDTDTEEDDLNATFIAYQQAGVAIHMVDLETLEDPDPAEIFARRFDVKPRSTLVEDPAFYARARGGFGGARGGPSPFGGSSTWGSGAVHFGGGG